MNEAHTATQTIRLHPRDNVAVALNALPIGISIEATSTSELIPAGFKVALTSLRPGEPVIKDGRIIGQARVDIQAGTRVHARNAEGVHGQVVEACPALSPLPLLPEAERATFEGYVRADGRVGTRNTLGVFIVGNCGATAARKAADWFDEDRLAEFANVDAVVPYIHELGCGMEMTGEPMDLLRRTLSGFIRNPNTAGAVVVALGCERNNLRVFLEQERLAVGDRLQTVTIQEVGGIAKAVAAAKDMISQMLPEANRIQRQTVSAEHLTLGLKSGTQDGRCGVSANPALGAAVDLLIRNGGTAILAETPDLTSIADDLVARGATPDVTERLSERINWWREYSQGRDTPATGRPDRLADEAGLINLFEKGTDSLKKAGRAPIEDVYRYAEIVQKRGLVFMDTPTYDPVSVTGQIAGGANLIALTTGQGSIFGSMPAPTVKIASNTETFNRMFDDTDIDCGPVLDGSADVAGMGQRIFDQLLRHASGEKTKAEIGAVGENEFVPWPIGVLA